MKYMNLPKEVEIYPYIRGIEDGFDTVSVHNPKFDNFTYITEKCEDGTIVRKYPYILLFNSIKVYLPLHSYIVKNTEGVKWVISEEYFQRNYVCRDVYMKLISTIK